MADERFIECQLVVGTDSMVSISEIAEVVATVHLLVLPNVGHVLTVVRHKNKTNYRVNALRHIAGHDQSGYAFHNVILLVATL